MRSLTVRNLAIASILLGTFCQYSQADEIYTQGPVVALHNWLGDQCSFVPDFDIGHCCVIHDMAYQAGGSEFDRKQADIAFRNCIRAEGRPLVASIYYWGVRVFGWLFFNYS